MASEGIPLHDLFTRLSRVEDQVRGIEKMLDAGRIGGAEQEAELNEASDAIARLVRS